LAKLRSTEPLGDAPDGATFVATQTDAGQILGTVGYMSPEQVRGAAIDHRSDIFSFGSILYEMLRGQRAFKRNTGAETMTAILNEDPPEFSAPGTAPAPARASVFNPPTTSLSTSSPCPSCPDSPPRPWRRWLRASDGFSR
jgi:serine/threonine protein kinase